MNKIFYNIYVDIFLFSEVLLGVLALFLFFSSVKLLQNWDFESFSNAQLELEKSSYFVMVATNFITFFKFLLLLYFVYVIDELSNIVPGAMCGAGVLYENGYGIVLLGLKIVTLFLLSLFVSLNHYDLMQTNYPYFKLKSGIVLVASLLVLAEVFIAFGYFDSINLHEVVSCCSGLYGNLEGQNPLPFNLSINNLILLFNISFVVALLAMFLKNSPLAVIFFALFFYLAYYSVVYFFGLYIYELPTHKCPFCMMQKEYGYIGYFLWITLIFGTFAGIIDAIFNIIGVKKSNLKYISLVLLLIFISICYYFVASYYLKNGVFL